MRTLILCVPLLLVGCAALDWATGADQPKTVEGGDPNLDAEPEAAPIDILLGLVKGTGPYGAGAAAALAFLAGQYRERRRKEKA